MYLLAICIFSLEMFIQTFSPFLTRLFAFCLFSFSIECMYSLYILDFTPFLDTQF